MGQNTRTVPYVLITPACNEEKLIEKTLQSVVKQTVLPVKWVIVNDGSTDATASIVSRYVEKHDWIKLVSLPKRKGRNFAAKVHAFNAGKEGVKDVMYEVIGNLDADVSLDEDHFEFLMNKFRDDPELGVAGTIFTENGYSSAIDSFEGQNYVSGQCQMFRRQCFEEIGGYFPSKNGGIDWIAVTTARMIGWKTRSYREKSFLHHRVLGTADRGILGSAYAYGKKDYYMGGHPLWELFRCCYRLIKKPYILGGMALFLGYLVAFVKGEARPVSDELMKFHRQEQMRKLKKILAFVCTLKRIDSFELMPTEQSARPAALRNKPI
ncbi:MAG: glycosyl transferase [Acidobacteria bacterium]|nr:MAG: glycosyl transferase [Acidobacteriota bacterium]